jgi:hypothetical protein
MVWCFFHHRDNLPFFTRQENDIPTPRHAPKKRHAHTQPGSLNYSTEAVRSAELRIHLLRHSGGGTDGNTSLRRANPLPETFRQTADQHATPATLNQLKTGRDT